MLQTIASMDRIVVPSVTQILRATIPGQWQASEWHKQKGRAVHAACAFLAKQIPFEYDPMISGQIAACEKFLKTYRLLDDGVIYSVEVRFESKFYFFSGQPDLVASPFIGMKSAMNRIETVFDYKATLTDTTELQLAGYAELVNCRWGMGVQLNDDGSFKTTELLDLKKAKREFLALRSCFATLERLGKLPKKEDFRT